MTTALLYFMVAGASAWIARVRWKVAVVLVLLPLAFTGRALLTGRVFAPIDLPYGAEPLSWMKGEYGVGEIRRGVLSDVFSHNIPWRYAVRDAYAHREAPLWNPHLFAGDVLAAAAQPAAYDPLLLLSLLLPLPNSLTFLASISLFLAGLGMYLLLRDLALPDMAALTGSAAWMFSTFVAFWLEWALGATTVWLPLLCLAVRRVVRQRSLRATALLTFVFVMIVLAGHPETALHLVALGAVWAVGELWAVRGREIVRTAILGIGAGVVALMVTAIYLLPVMDALPQTFEHELRRGFYKQMKKSEPLPIVVAKLEAQLVPFIGGMPQSEWPEGRKFDPPLESASCGSAALALAIAGAWRARSRAKWIALVFIVIGILFGIKVWPFVDLLGKLPLFDVALNDRLVVAAAFGIAILAALGVAALDRRALILVSIVLTVVLALACANAWSRMLALGLTPHFIKTQTAILIAGPLLVALIAATARGRAACALLLLAIVAQRTLEVGDIYPTLSKRMFYPPIPVFAALPKTSEPFRIVGHQYELVPNSATLYGLEDVRGYQALRLKRWVETVEMWSIPQGPWWNRVDDLSSPFLSMLNVRYALSPSAAPAPPPWWRKVASQPGTNLFENSRAFGRAFVPRSVRLGYPKDVTLMQMKLEPDFAQRAWIDAQRTVPVEEVNGPGSVRVERKGRGELLIHASMSGGGWVVITQSAWKGWRAFVDGKRSALRYANHAWLAVYVPQGEHTVRMQFLPESFVIGAWISSAALALLALYFIVAVFVGTKRFDGGKFLAR